MTQYLIAHIGHTSKSCEHITWWKPERRGYTYCIEKAGQYSEGDARSICRDGRCIAVPKAIACLDARSTPYYRRSDGTLHKLYDGGPHRVVPNEGQIWKRLFAERLGGCERPDKVTPKGVKARAIYLDGLEGGSA